MTEAESRTCYEERGTEEGICDGVKEGEGVNVLCVPPSLISPPHLLCREGQEEAPVQVSQHTQEVKKEGEAEREVSCWSLQLCGLSGTFSLPLLPHFPCLLPPLSSSSSLSSLPLLPPSSPSLSSLPLLPPSPPSLLAGHAAERRGGVRRTGGRGKLPGCHGYHLCYWKSWAQVKKCREKKKSQREKVKLGSWCPPPP